MSKADLIVDGCATKNSVIKTELRSVDVAVAPADICQPLCTRAMSSQVPGDGGNTRVILER